MSTGGAASAGLKYWPFGAERTGMAPIDKGYTGQQKENVTTLGAYYYKARFYSTTLGKFLSPDPFVPEDSSRGWNRYAYAYSSP